MQLIFPDNYIEYRDAMQWFADIGGDNVEEKVFVLEHNNVYTAGKSVKNNQPDYNHNNTICGVPIVHTARGGLWTWHGKGQVVVYFIYNLRKRGLTISDFMQKIENTTLSVVNAEVAKISNTSPDKLGIMLYADINKRGFWVKYVNQRCNNAVKIAKFGFIGLRVSKGIVYHGISVNYNNDLIFFNYINPCGLGDVKITSVFEMTSMVGGVNNNLDINKFKLQLGSGLFQVLNQ